MPVTVPQPALMQASAPGQPRTATAILQGFEITVPCPQWCSMDHTEHPLHNLADLEHEGPAVSLSVCGEQTVIAYLNQWPFSGQPEAYLAVEATVDGETAELPASAALAFADQLVAHAEAIRNLAATLGGAA